MIGLELNLNHTINTNIIRVSSYINVYNIDIYACMYIEDFNLSLFEIFGHGLVAFHGFHDQPYRSEYTNIILYCCC